MKRINKLVKLLLVFMITLVMLPVNQTYAKDTKTSVKPMSFRMENQVGINANIRFLKDNDSIIKRDNPNTLLNGDFEESEESPTIPNGPAGTWWNAELWKDNKKAVNWDFQRWNIDQSNSNFLATLDTSIKKSGNQSAKITVKNSNSNTQAFLKQNGIAVAPNTYYDLSFYSKLENLNGSQGMVRVEEYTPSNSKVKTTDFQFGKGTIDWLQKEEYFKTANNTTKINLIFIIPSLTTGSVWIDDVYLGIKDISLKEILLDESKVVLSKGDTKTLTVDLNPKFTNEPIITWESTNPNIATVNQSGVVEAITQGEATITVFSDVHPELSASCIVKVVDGDILVDELKIVDGDIVLDSSKNRFMNYETLPKTAINSDLEVIWSSSNEKVFTVNSTTGLVQPKGNGEALLMLSAKEDPSITTSIKITVLTNTVDKDYNLMKNRWLQRIIGGENLNLNNEHISNYVDDLSQDAERLWEAMDCSKDRTFLWPIQDGDTSSADITTQFSKLNKLALAFGTKGSTLEGNRALYFDILDAMKFMTTTKKYNGVTGTSNWWDCQIGAAQQFTDTLMILSKYMDDAEVENYAKCIAGYASDPSKQWGGYTATGANRTDIGISVLGTGILLKDDDKMDLIVEKIPQVFQLVTSGDGLYADGSLVQHTFFAYSGSYGNELMKGIGRILSITEKTRWEITDPAISNVYNTIKNGYIPLMQQGRMMSMVSGRSITRAPKTNKFSTEYSAGQETISNIMVISKFAPDSFAKQFDKNVKYWIETSKDTYDFFAHARDIEALQNAERIMNDQTINSEYTFKGTKIFSMDRVVQTTKNYSIGISMYSSRSGNYELQTQGSGTDIKYENIKGWHQADGAMYLYNNDYNTYNDGYWATVDSYRLPGTTVDTKELAIGAGKGVKSKQPWVGGASDGKFGAVGMYLDKTNVAMDLTAKKSWFLFDDKVIAIGSDINGTTDASIETIVENRLLSNGAKKAQANKVLINGSEDNGAEKTQVLPEKSWVHLEGSKNDSDIGYYFPEGGKVTTMKESREDSYLSINTLFVDNIMYKNDYFKMMVQHGKTVNDGTYSYVLLPNKNAAETESYAQNNTVEILEKNDDVHAIKDTTENIFAMNVWKNAGYSLNGFTVDKQSSLIVKQTGDELKITIADPTRNQGKIKITMEKEYLDIVSSDSRITPLADGKSFEFTSIGSDGGKSSSITLKIEVPLNFVELEEMILHAKTIDETIYTPSTYAALQKQQAVAENVLKNAETQKEIDDAKENLLASIDGLVKRADITKLKELVQECEQLEAEKYTSVSWQMYMESLIYAKNIAVDVEATQTIVDKVTEQLLNARNSLIERNPTEVLDKSKLESLIIDFSKQNSNDYTKDSWNNFIKTLSIAKEIFNSSTTTQEEINWAVTNLEKAKEELKLISKASVKPSIKATNTSDSTSILLMIYLLLMGISGMSFSIYRRRK